MDPNNVDIGLAFLAGVVSFLSPCVLSLVPAYLGYLGSRAITPEGVAANKRWETMSHGLAFVLGFSVVFVALGAAAGALGALLYDARGWITKIGGAVVIVLGLHTMGVLRLPFLDYDTRRQQLPDKRLGYLASALMGVFFSAGWSPCIGPVLGAVLTLALKANSAGWGMLLLSVYSLGLGVPFLLAAAGMGQVSVWLQRYRKYMRYMSIVAGVFLILIGILLLTDSLQILATYASVSKLSTALDEGVVTFWQHLTGKR